MFDGNVVKTARPFVSARYYRIGIVEKNAIDQKMVETPTDGAKGIRIAESEMVLSCTSRIAMHSKSLDAMSPLIGGHRG